MLSQLLDDVKEISPTSEYLYIKVHPMIFAAALQGDQKFIDELEQMKDDPLNQSYGWMQFGFIGTYHGIAVLVSTQP